MSRLNVPYVYTVEVAVPGGHPPRIVQVASSITAEVPSVDAEDAPVRFKLELLGKRAPKGTLVYRMHEGTLLKQFPSGAGTNSGAFDRPVAKDGAAARLDEWARNARERTTTNDVILSRGGALVRRALPESRLCKMTVLASDKDSRLAAVEAEWGKAAFVAGVLHVPTDGPGVVVCLTSDITVNRGRTKGVTLVARPEYGWIAGEGLREPFFHVSNMDGAAETAKASLAALRHRVKKSRIGDWAVAEAPYFDYRVEGERLPVPGGGRDDLLVAAARTAIDKTKNILHEVDTATVRAWAAVRDAIMRGASAHEIAPDALALGERGLASSARHWHPLFRGLRDRARAVIDPDLEIAPGVIGG